jgi:hypothetical protein
MGGGDDIVASVVDVVGYYNTISGEIGKEVRKEVVGRKVWQLKAIDPDDKRELGGMYNDQTVEKSICGSPISTSNLTGTQDHKLE